jgi:hypothetical protein
MMIGGLNLRCPCIKNFTVLMSNARTEVAKAGHDVLVGLFPAQSARLDADYQT